MAFHREFRPNEPVRLVIKTTGNSQYINGEINKIKSNLRIYHDMERYKPEVLICGRIPDDQMHNLHKSCHCMVMPSYGEAYCRPVVDALGYGNTPIVTDQTGMTDYIGDCGWIVKSNIEPIYTIQPPLSDIYTSKEKWARINVQDLQECMRNVYKNKDNCSNRCDMKQFSYKNIGQNIQKVLDDIAN